MRAPHLSVYVAERLSISLTLVLTTAAFKLATLSLVPALPYMTLLDGYLLVRRPPALRPWRLDGLPVYQVDGGELVGVEERHVLDGPVDRRLLGCRRQRRLLRHQADERRVGLHIAAQGWRRARAD